MVRPQANNIISQGLSFLIYKMGMTDYCVAMWIKMKLGKGLDLASAHRKCSFNPGIIQRDEQHHLFLLSYSESE